MEKKVLFIESCWSCPYIGHAYLKKTGRYCNHPKSTMKYNISAVEKGIMTDEEAKNGFWDGCPLGSIEK